MLGKGSDPTVRKGSESLRFIAVFAAVAPAMFLGAIDETIVATALPIIAARFESFAHIAWVVTAYLLAATVAAPIYGRLGDAIGRKTALLGALALFVAGSLVCAIAPNFVTLVTARAIQGLGGGGLMTLAQALIGEAVSPRDRGRFQGWFSAIFVLSATLGPVLGGVLSEHADWRWIFWINLPLGIGATAAALRIKAEPGQGGFTLDVPGTGLFIAATLALLLALSLGSGVGWGSPMIVLLFAFGVIGLCLVLPLERRVRSPLLSPNLLAQPVVWRSAICVLLFASALFASVVQVPLLLQILFRVSPSVSGLLLVPLTLAQVGVSTWAGLRISSNGLPKGPLVGGLAMATVGFVVLSATLSLGPLAVALASVLFGLGLGATMPAAQTLAQWAGGKARLGAATATLSFARSVGGVVGTAVTAAVLLGVVEHTAPGSTARIQALLGGAGAAGDDGGLKDLAALTDGFRWVFGVIAMMTLGATLLATTIPRINLDDPEPQL